MRKSFVVMTGISVTTMILCSALTVEASTKIPFTLMTPNTRLFPFKVTSVTPSVTVNRTKGIVYTKYQNASKTDWVVELATNTDSRLDPIPKRSGESVKLKGHVTAQYLDDGHLQRIQFTRNGVYYLIFAGKGKFKGWVGSAIHSYKPLTTKRELIRIANSMAPNSK